MGEVKNLPDALSVGKKQSWFKRLLLVQETGLLLVIAMIAILLTFRGGQKLAQFPVELPASSTSSEISGSVIEVTKAGDAAAVIANLASPAPDGITLDRSYAGDGAVVLVDGKANFFPQARLVANGANSRLILVKSVNKFLDLGNLASVLNAASYIAIMAVGMTAIIAMGGIDLSVGSIYGLCGILAAMALQRLQGDRPESASLFASLGIGLLVSCTVGAVMGAFNGSLIVGLRVHPFIISLGMMSAYSGIVFVVTQGQSISGLPSAFTTGFFKAEAMGLYPAPLASMVLVGLLGTAILTSTVLGRQIMAIGGNEVAARYAGISVGKVKIIAYALMGLLAGLSACVSIGYFGAAAPDSGRGYELRVIAAAVIGGASLAGGRGSAFGAVLGAIIVELINNGMIILDIPQSYTQIVMGAAIIAAVVLDQTKTRLGGRQVR